MSTATIHTLAESVAGQLRGRPEVLESVAHHWYGTATVSVELTNGQRFELTVTKDPTD